MKVKTLLNHAKRCKHSDEAYQLLNRFTWAVSKLACINTMDVRNEEASMESDTPFIRFELSDKLSNTYIISISPLIRMGELSVLVSLYRMNDGSGDMSKSWKLVGDEFVISPHENEEIGAVLEQALNQAKFQHACLLESVGIPYELAKETVNKRWHLARSSARKRSRKG